MKNLTRDGGRYHCLPKAVKAKSLVDMRVFILLRPFNTDSASTDYCVQTMERLPLYYQWRSIIPFAIP